MADIKLYQINSSQETSKSGRQQNLPMAIKYSGMLAQMLPYFDGNEIPGFGKDNLWFL